MRFTNHQIYNEFDAVIEQIIRYEDEHDQHGEVVYIIGGATIYEQFLPFADQIELTQVHRTVEGDTFFPEFEDNFHEVRRECYDDFDFVTYAHTAQAVFAPKTIERK